MTSQYENTTNDSCMTGAEVDTIEHLWIPMADGVQLSARLWKPKAQLRPARYPAILEYIPYRKRDMVRLRDERNHPFFAANGYVCLRVDMRGSGDSEGVMPDMYDEKELDDARQVIAWIAEQSWCDGNVGMFGTSWGGTASLQAAIDAPSPLKAVLANCATADRFEDDIHWMGGALLTDSLEWGATLPSILAAPPDPDNVGEDWQRIWHERLEKISFPFENWARNDRRGTYWRHGSALFAADRLSCPVLNIGGWSDRYANSVMQLVAARPDLCYGIVGPWGHHYPDTGDPGPAINFQQVALEWWNEWLKPGQSEKPERPRLIIWQRQFDPPQSRLEKRNGQWRAGDYPVAQDQIQLYLGTGTLSTTTQDDATLAVSFDLRHGECAGDTGYFGRVGGLPLEQSPDDARALCFDTAPLEVDTDLFGHAGLTITINPAQLPAQLACRICEVTADGVSNLVTRTVLALELDENLDDLRLPQSDGQTGMVQRYRITFPSMAYRFAAGSRIRLALSASYWPLVWPVSNCSALEVSTTNAVLHLPGLPAGMEETPAPFPAAEVFAGNTRHSFSSAGPLERMPPVTEGGRTSQGWQLPALTTSFADLGLDFTVRTSAQYEYLDRDPATACCSISNSYIFNRKDGQAQIDSSITMQARTGGYTLTSSLTARWNGKEIFTRSHGFDGCERVGGKNNAEGK